MALAHTAAEEAETGEYCRRKPGSNEEPVKWARLGGAGVGAASSRILGSTADLSDENTGGERVYPERWG